MLFSFFDVYTFFEIIAIIIFSKIISLFHDMIVLLPIFIHVKREENDYGTDERKENQMEHFEGYGLCVSGIE